jgi:hypothetical protein
MTSGKSLNVSRRMIFLEQTALPVVKLIDLWAVKFNNEGIPIIKNDLVSSLDVNPAETAPIYRKKIPKAISDKLLKDIIYYCKKTLKNIWKNDFLEIANQSVILLKRIKSLEKKHCSHLAMSAHFVESIGIGALHSIIYSEISNNRTNKLSRVFLAVQILTLPGCLKTDIEAQKLHSIGCGIVVNDVPHIPLLKEWNEFNSKNK